MYVKVLLVRVEEGYQVRVIALDEHPRSWLKLYRTREFCMDQLRASEMLTLEELERAVLHHDLDQKGVILTFDAEVEAILLRAIGFKEIRRLYVH